MVTSVLSFPASCKNPASTNVALSFTNDKDEVAPVACGARVGAIVDAVAVAGAGASEDVGVVAVTVSCGGTGGTEDTKAVAGVAAGATEDLGAWTLLGRSE